MSGLPDRAVGVVRRFVQSLDQGVRADRLLARLLRDAPELDRDERQCVAEWSLGLCVWRGRLDAMAAGDRELWLPLFLIDRAGRPLEEAASATGAPLDRLRSALLHQPGPQPGEQLAFRRSLPLWLAERWIEQFGADRADALAAAMNERGPIAIRCEVPREELRSQLEAEGVSSRPSLLSDRALLLEGRPNIVGLDSWRQGLFEVQDEGSQLIGEAVGARPGELVLELCAGSGGKTLALASSMRNEGRIVSVDTSTQRLIDLEVRLKRHRLSCVQAVCADATFPERIPLAEGAADAVLVDAPCSALGTLRRSPDARWQLTPEEIDGWCATQTKLLRSAQRFVRPGGRLVYATCSVDHAENEGVARTVPADHFELIEQRRTSPDVDGCDGFFWSVWRRRVDP